MSGANKQMFVQSYICHISPILIKNKSTKFLTLSKRFTNFILQWLTSPNSHAWKLIFLNQFRKYSISWSMSSIKAAAYLKLNFFTYILMSKSYFVEHFLRRTNLRGFHYFAYGGCYNYHIITVLNIYHMFLSRCAQKFF